ncbi:MAG: FtsX-like permease family protein [Gemmatimonadales bacterium]|nr:FtsX-like permease family protein [Gemmatimonadales bacterium]NIN12674.1 FtsX-like permease family protein [Gemmatimonadales bacterium]NIN50954.1 FtsX-like permease family protein [Gemmatimonadales bacterium]NIP08418.1 FtsX-like permease family protein [Gemmatimonadales bacterium]NIR03602.1 FtsX-like permease family protein [Gemmatimonadales bacterium]
MPDWNRYVRERLPLPALRDLGEERIYEELADHLEHVFRDALARGLSEVEAEAYAIEQLGDLRTAAQDLVGSERFQTRSAIESWQEDAEIALQRKGGGWMLLSDLSRDLRYALRSLRRSPGFLLVAVVTFALGIGANTAIFSVLNTVLFQPLPYPEPERLVTIWTPQIGYNFNPMSAPDYHDYLDATTVFAAWGVYTQGRANLTQGDTPERLASISCTAGLLRALGILPARGRLFTKADEQDAESRLVLLSDGLWKRRFGSDTSLVGGTITLNREPHTVVGILPPEFRFPGWRSLRNADVYTLLWVPRQGASRGSYYLYGIGRLRDDLTLERADRELNTIAAGLAAAYPESNHQRIARAVPLRDVVIGDAGGPLWILMGAVGFVLLIACTNVAGLLLARSAVRTGEVAIRASLGAGMSRLMRQLLAEGCVLSLLGSVAGLLLAWWGIGALRGVVPSVLPRVTDMRIDGPVLLFTLGLSLVTGVVFGLVPAVWTSRVELTQALQENRRSGATGVRKSRFLAGVVVTQFALALVLVNGAALMLKSLWNATGSRELHEPERVLIAGISLDGPDYEEPAARDGFLSELLERVRGLPGVVAAGATTRLPLSGGWTGHVLAEGEEYDPAAERPMVMFVSATADYFDAMGISLLRGRQLRREDADAAQVSVVINQTFAERYWPNQDPVGRRIQANSPSPWFRAVVVGVVEDIRQYGLESDIYREVYFPFFPSFTADRWLVVRTAGDPSGLVPPVRQELAAIDREIPLSSVFNGTDLYSFAAQGRSFVTLLFGLFALVALCLIAAGAYGVMAFDVARRTHEIGVRAAMGASRKSIVRLVLSRGFRLSLFGVTLGLGGAVATARITGSLLYQVGPLNVVSVSLTMGFLALVGLLASTVPAVRAASVDPVRALHSE